MSFLQRLSFESGFDAIFTSSIDIKLLCLQRFIRLFAYGASFIILVQFLNLVGNTDRQVGLFMTLSLLGDVFISFVLSLVTDKVGRKRVLAIGSLLMLASGSTFVLSSSYWALLAAATFGVISPSGNEIGPFRAVEESILAQLTPEERRSDIFAWYNMCGTAGAAVGTLLSGWTIQLLQNVAGFSTTSSYRAIFVLYALLGSLKLGFTLALSWAVEAESYHSYHSLPTDTGLEDANTGERDPALGSGDAEDEQTTRAAEPQRPSLYDKARSYLPHISRSSLSTLVPLLLLFTLDSMASGFASPSWLTYFFTTYHSLSSSYLGTVFFTTNIIATLSNLAALPIARRLGPLRTMVFTHLPSAIFLGLIPVPSPEAPGTAIAVLFLAIRACTQSMDQAPRQAFIAAAVKSEERTAVLGTVNTAKTLAQATGLGVAGLLAEGRRWTLMFGGAGFMKASYDLLLLWLFHLTKR